MTDEPEAVDPRENARNRRRDHDASAAARALLRPGMGKVFKQILDAQRRAGKEPRPASDSSHRGSRKRS